MNIKKIAACLAASASVAVVAAVPCAAAPSGYTYDQFSMMFGRNAGQYDDATGYPSGQWAWTPVSSTESDIAWGDPATWPPSQNEQFEHVGDWVTLDGFNTANGWEPQVVTREVLGDVTCANEVDITPADGHELYSKWQVDTVGYCLEAWGQILVPGGAVVNFHHRQIWHTPANCSNQYMGTQLCVRDHEWWYDDNPANGGTPGQPLVESQDRDVYFALNVGPAYIIHDYLHNGWEAYDRYTWQF